MARTSKAAQPLPALPASVGELGPGTERSKELSVWLLALQMREQEGDAAASAALIEAYNTVPRLWERVAGLQGNAERSWLDLMVPPETGRAFTREGIRRELERVRADAAGPAPSPLERVLADRVALCWIAAMHADTQYAQRLADGMTWADSEYHQRRCERAQRQLLKAVQTLAMVRRLLTPTVQVNVAENQINVAQ